MNGNSDNKRRISYIKVAAESLVNCWHAHPPLFFGIIIASALLCAVEVGEIFAMRQLFDTVAEYVAGDILLNGVLAAAMPMTVILLASPFMRILQWLAQGYFWRRGSGYLMARYHERIRHIPLIDFEKTETFEQMKKALIGSEESPSVSQTLMGLFFYSIPYLLFAAAFLISVKPILVIALLIIFISVVFAQIIRAGILRRFEEENIGLRRESEYLESCITGKDYVKETRTLGAVGYFFGLFIDSIKRFNKESMKTERRIARIELLLRFVNVLGYAGILALLVYYVIEGSVSVGAFASVFYSVERINGVLKGIVDDLGGILQELSMASFTHGFINTPKSESNNGEGSKTPLDKKVGIILDSVSFGYPGCNKNVLQDITLTINYGETLAVVGENGAGKTTLTKIIIGLYRPTTGEVRYGNENIHSHDTQSRFKHISSVFQNFIRYKLTARENISISDSDAELRPNIDRAAHEAGIHLAHLSGGVDTVLSREFDGAELSGGQWQRVAIARGLYRKHDIIVLDEPTAAIDPIEESNIFRLFKESAQDKTAILVTHRLGSTKIADRILLMEDGQICELGTHEQLMAQGGKYAKMYHEQASWYKR